MDLGSQREQSLFEAALDFADPAQRHAFLEQACGEDKALRQRIEQLLALSNSADAFFTECAPALERAAVDVDPAQIPAAAQSALEPEPGQSGRIGPYKLLQKLGEGGCGVVYIAEQERPVRRRVALKLIKPGMDTKSVMARFEAERQALALMDHPNIAKVFDAGATESGRPYFVMELVRGVKITAYCDKNALTTEERLGVFVQVCRAVQHAHQKGIIHRDIKPSNILVTTTEGDAALPVIIDFGIAKATTNQRLTDSTLFTAIEMLIGTPAYMSPEQAELRGLDVDTRTDIYSLGVLLYELLTGSTPFDSGALMKAGLDEIRKVIRENDPARPSTRLSTMTASDLTSVAQRRHAAPPALIRSVRGDLDWIVMKALEKDRARRYETANGLALDVQRHLGNEAISAGPPSKIYRFQKLMQRNKILFVGIGVIAILLVASLVVVTAFLIKERRDRREAQKEAVKSRQVAELLEKKFAESEAVHREALASSGKGTEAESPQARRELEDLARELVAQKKFVEANQILDEALTPAFVRNPFSVRLLDLRTELLCRQSRWHDAAADAALAFEHDPSNYGHAPILAALYIKTQNRPGYEQLCTRLLKACGQTADVYVADYVAKACLFLPSSEVDLQAVGLLADTAVTRGVGDQGAMPFFEACKALSEYRQGHFAEAVNWAQKALKIPRIYVHGWAYATLAMAYWRLGEKEEARAMLAKGDELAPNIMPATIAEDLSNAWQAWLYARVQLDEATALIAPGSVDRREPSKK